MKELESERAWPLLYAAIVLLAAGFFLFLVRTALAPISTFILLLVLLSPYAGTRQYRVLVLTLCLALAIWLLRTLGSLMAPFVVALALAYIFDPVIDKLEARGMRRSTAVALLAVPLVVVLSLGMVFGIPALIDQAGQVADDVPQAVQRAVTWLDNARTRLERLPFFRGDAMARVLDSFSPERLAAYIQQRQAEIASRLWSGVLGVGKGLTVALTFLGYFVLVPVLVVYLLMDFDGIVRRVLSLMPVPTRTKWMPLLHEYNSLLSRYLRGQVLEAAIVGVLTWLGLLILGFPYSGFVGAVAGVFNLVPYLGLIVSAIPALVIALLSGNVLASLAKAAAVFLVVQVLDSTVTGPRIVGGSVGLHAVWVILAIAVGSALFGFIGLLLAMPAALLIKIVLREAIAKYRASAVYQDGLRAPEA